MSLNILLFIVIFLIGIYFYAKYGDPNNYEEGLHNNASTSSKRCPNMLIQQGSKFYLYNSKVAKVPGVNPIPFENLEDYTEFLDWQRSQGIRCPVLYLQQTYDAQGKTVYKVRPSVSEPQAGLPPSVASSKGAMIMETPPDDDAIQAEERPAYPTPIIGDAKYNSKNNSKSDTVLSPDPMDPNWGGVDYTQSLIDKGYYKGNEVSFKP